MKKWAYLLGVAAAIGAAAVVVRVALQRAADAKANEIPSLIDDCFQRIDRLEAELHRLKPASEPA